MISLRDMEVEEVRSQESEWPPVGAGLNGGVTSARPTMTFVRHREKCVRTRENVGEFVTISGDRSRGPVVGQVMLRTHKHAGTDERTRIAGRKQGMNDLAGQPDPGRPGNLDIRTDALSGRHLYGLGRRRVHAMRIEGAAVSPIPRCPGRCPRRKDNRCRALPTR